MKKWEYYVVRIEVDKGDSFGLLPSLGKLGWELCSSLYLDAINVIIYIFKRELQDERKNNNTEQ